MALTPSTMLALGTPAPDFRLPDYEGKLVSLSDFAAPPGLLEQGPAGAAALERATEKVGTG